MSERVMPVRRSFRGWLRLLLLPLFVLQFPIDLLLGNTLIFNSWAWLRAVGYQVADQPWYALYAERFLIGQQSLGEASLWLGLPMTVLQPLLWAALIGAVATWASRLSAPRDRAGS